MRRRTGETPAQAPTRRSEEVNPVFVLPAQFVPEDACFNEICPIFVRSCGVLFRQYGCVKIPQAEIGGKLKEFMSAIKAGYALGPGEGAQRTTACDADRGRSPRE
jgi:hypothetical protein